MTSSSVQSLLYESLHLNERSIRLIKLLPKSNEIIRCHVVVTDMDTKPTYTALSYTWGPPSFEAKLNGTTAEKKCKIICNDTEVRVTENLYHFLCRAYQNLPEYSQYFWIDAISINQEDKDEKSREVKKMAEIYGSASDLLIWLGEEDEHTHEAIELIRVLASKDMDELMGNEDLKNPFILDDPERLASVLGAQITPLHWISLGLLLQRTWFSRIWIVQEVILSENISVLCGGCRLDWEEELLKVTNYLVGSKWAGTLRSLQEEGESYPVGLGPWVLGGLRAMYNEEEGLSLARALILTRGFLATEKIDHVYGLLGLINERSSSSKPGQAGILPDYRQSPAQTFTLVAKRIMLASNSLGLICEASYEQSRQLHNLPSWAPNWSITNVSTIGRISDEIFSAARDMDQDVGFDDDTNLLRVTGTRLDTISLTGAEKVKIQTQRLGLPSWIRLLAQMDGFYSVTGQSRAEVFWRTLIYDLDGDSSLPHPASASLIQPAFRNWLTLVAAQSRRVEENLDDWDAMLAAIDDFSVACQEIPPASDILRWVDILDSEDRATELSFRPSIQPFERGFVRSPRTAPFLTSQKFMGMGPDSSTNGDEVWILPRCHVPVVLRKTATEGVYKLMGESYVHGFMHGEALDSQILDFVDIAIE